MSYSLNLDSTLKSNNETSKNNSPPEIICHTLRENILSLRKKNDLIHKNIKVNFSDSLDISQSKNENKLILLEPDGKTIIASKKLTEMDIILEERDENNRLNEKKNSNHINPNKKIFISKGNNNVITQVKIENVLIDFKKKNKLSNTEVKINPLKK